METTQDDTMGGAQGDSARAQQGIEFNFIIKNRLLCFGIFSKI
jgi:hypothetical protein